MSVYYSYLYSLIIITGLELSLVKPAFFGWAAGLTLFFNAFFIWLAARAKFNANFWKFLISPFLFLLGGLIFLGFSNSFVVKELIIIFLVAANTIFLYYLITYSYHKYSYKDHSLSIISRIINISSIFFLFSGFYYLQAFLKIPLWILLIAAGLVSYLIVYQFFSISKIKSQTNKTFVLVCSMIILELFYIVHWLPLIAIVKGILITSTYYFLTSLARHYINSTLARTVWLRYSLVNGLIWILTLLTARWE